MKELENIKNNFAIGEGYYDFDHLILDAFYSGSIKEVNKTIDELIAYIQEEKSNLNSNLPTDRKQHLKLHNNKI